jgi:hypothetical protein
MAANRTREVRLSGMTRGHLADREIGALPHFHRKTVALDLQRSLQLAISAKRSPVYHCLYGFALLLQLFPGHLNSPSAARTHLNR